MAAAVYISLWAAFGLIGPNGLVGPKPMPRTIIPVPVSIPAEVSREAPAVALPNPPEAPPIVAGISGRRGDSSALVGQMQRALAKRGYRVGADNHFDSATVRALQAFQGNMALTVQPVCDQQCWNALGLVDPE
jgi:hypothetical protein